MSASLVGSEMCIRDSDAPASSCAPEASPEAPCAIEASPEALRRFECCLLYTSDAADDCSV
eukprot:12878482-Alexandrium_andersonii.AAC.1